MGIVAQKSLKTLITTYAGLVLGYINTLWLYPLLLTKEEVGLIRLLVSVAFLFATFASLGAMNIPNKFFPYFNDKGKKQNEFLFFLLTWGTIGLILFTIVFFSAKDLIYSIFASKAPLLNDYYYYFYPLTLIALYHGILESYIIIQNKPVVPAFIKEVLVRFLFSAGLIAIWLKIINFGYFVDFVLIIYLFGLLILIIYTKNIGSLLIKPNFSLFRNRMLKEIMLFGSFVFLATAGNLIIFNIDAIMLSAYKGLGATGVYTIAFFIATLIEIPKRSLSKATISFVSQANKDNDYKRLEMLYKKSSITQLIIGSLLFIGIWCNIENIFRLMPNSEIYIAGKWVVFLIGLAKLFDLITGINGDIIGTSKYYKIDIIFLLFLAVLAVITNVIFIPIYGITGAALASAISFFLFNILRSVFVFIKFKIQPFSTDTIKVLIISGIVFFVNYILPSLNNLYLDVAVRSFVILILFGSLVIITNSSEDINDLVSIFFKKLF